MSENTYEANVVGMTCNSCERAIAREMEKAGGAQLLSVRSSDGRMAFKADPADLGKVRDAVERAGYKLASYNQVDANSAKQTIQIDTLVQKDAGVELHQAIKGVWRGEAKWEPERKLLINSAATLVLLGLLLAGFTLGPGKGITGFQTNYLPFLALGVVSTVALAAAGYHFNLFHKPLSCTLGMMEGMTFGMMAGFMLGAIFGATNGMFWGSAFGMLFGIGAGVWAGTSSGVMGVMEGLMAGIMAGPMGAMLSVMLLAEPLPIFLALLTGLCSIVLLALTYMRVKELGVANRPKAAELTSMLSTCIILFAAIAVLMIFGPHSGIVWRG